jgi:phosphohistidine phosphatase
MELILWRHAEAETGEPDLGRKLTSKGEKQARRVAAWLHAHLPESTKVLVSPATRAQQTARALADIAPRKLKTVEALAPGASVDDILQAADWPASKTPKLVVGHQPTLGLVASRVLTGAELPWSIRKAAVWWLSTKDNEAMSGADGAAKVVLRAVVNPDLI